MQFYYLIIEFCCNQQCDPNEGNFALIADLDWSDL